HYPKISKIVKETALEFGLPYNEYRTTRAAIVSHFKALKELGKQPAVAVAA
ncbi:MAG: acyl-CoA desaturase, partial [Saprospiraceae bacterium]|nr:acyl-CoA desaturase [Saprospiraceae bacterium]